MCIDLVLFCDCLSKDRDMEANRDMEARLRIESSLQYATRSQLVEITARCDSSWPVWKPKWTKDMIIDRLLKDADGLFTFCNTSSAMCVMCVNEPQLSVRP